jgi:hypothetical protein
MTEVPGLFSTDGYVWIGERSSTEIADVILKRLPTSAETQSEKTPVSPGEQQFALPNSSPVVVKATGDETASNPIVCPMVLVKHRDESRRFCLQMQNLIATRDAIKTILAVKELATNDLELTDFAIAGAKDKDFAQGIEPKKAVFFRIGAGVPDREYTIQIKVGTSKGDILVGQCRIRVVA